MLDVFIYTNRRVGVPHVISIFNSYLLIQASVAI